MSSPREPLALVGIGEAMILFQTDFGTMLAEASTTRVDVAGAELNACAAMARFGARTALLTRLGDDPAGQRVRNALRENDVEHDLIAFDARPTGLLIRETLDDGERRVSYYRRGSAASAMDASDAERLRREDPPAMLLVSGLTAVLGAGPRAAMRSAVEKAAAAGTTIVVDANLRPHLGALDESVEFVHEILPRTDILFLGDEEAVELFGESEPEAVFSAAASLGVREVVLKFGADGVCCVGEDGEVLRQPSRASIVQDPVGTGDALCGAYLAARWRCLTRNDALEIGSRVAGGVVETMGDLDGLPSREDATALIASYPPR